MGKVPLHEHTPWSAWWGAGSTPRQACPRNGRGPPPSCVGARAGCRSGARAGSSEGLQKWVLLPPCGRVLVHPQAGRWASGCPSARGTGAMGFLTVFTAISAEEHLCWRLLCRRSLQVARGRRGLPLGAGASPLGQSVSRLLVWSGVRVPCCGSGGCRCLDKQE